MSEQERVFHVPPGVTLRPFEPADIAFLRTVYASTREAEMQMVPWTDEQKRQFLDMQFDAQHTHYQAYYPDANFDVIEQEGTAIGRLYVHWRSDSIHIMDFTLLPEFRGNGIGTAFMRALMTAAEARGSFISLYVEDFNPAYRLYQRLGFQPQHQHGVYTMMEWKP